MDTVELEEKIYLAFSKDTDLMDFLPKGEESIFHLQAPSVEPDYPILVYSPISDVPVLHGDNREKLHRVTIRVHIITDDGDYSKIYSAVKNIMSDLGYTRLQTTPFMEDGKKMLIADFRIITED